MIVGGVASKLGGGKFEDGAMTAAFEFLYNECGRTRMCGMGQGGYAKSDSFEVPQGLDFTANEKLAESMASIPYLERLAKFRGMVNYRAPWDYKTLGEEFENFGNYHYGFMGSAAGFSDETLLRAAGYVQRANVGSEWFGTKASLFGVIFGFGGSGYFGDDPKDQYWIKKGIEARRGWF